jgi:hypothetical protein
LHFKIPQANCLWANFGTFWQFWADFSALATADSMPKLRLKSLKPHNFRTMSPNAMCSISLESCNPYLQSQKVSKNPKIYCIHSSLLKSAKSHFGCLCPLGVKFF